MIKNLLLLIILSALIGFTYYWEELDKKKKYTSQTEYKKLFSFMAQDVLEINLTNLKLIKKDSRWIIGELDYKASKTKVDYILKTLEGLQIISKLKIDPRKYEEFFTHQNHSFRIRTFDNEYFLRLGDISNISGFFYLELSLAGQKNLYLVKDDNIYEGLYKNALEAEFQKYISFKKIITSAPQQLIDNNLLPYFKFNLLETVAITAKSRPKFELNLKENKTTPQIFKNLKYKNIRQHFISLFKSLNVESIRKIKTNVLSELQSSIIFIQNGSNIELRLYGKLNDELGSYITISNSDWIYSISDKSKKVFFVDVQDFWNKKFIYPRAIHEYDRFIFELGDTNNQYKFEVDDISNFEIKIDDNRLDSINAGNLNLLFNIMFNLVNFKESRFVYNYLSNLDKNIPTFELKLLNKRFKFQFLQYLIIVQDVDLKLEYHFIHKNQSIMINDSTDFFTLKSKKK
jgi:hypothetical protein